MIDRKGYLEVAFYIAIKMNGINENGLLGG